MVLELADYLLLVYKNKNKMNNSQNVFVEVSLILEKRRRHYDDDNDNNEYKNDSYVSSLVSVSPLGKKMKHRGDSCEGNTNGIS